MTEDKLKKNWTELVTKIKKKWNKLTDQDLEKVKGQKDKLIALIQEKCGETKESIEDAVNNLLDTINNTVNKQ